jgi:hypothetical protein
MSERSSWWAGARTPEQRDNNRRFGLFLGVVVVALILVGAITKPSPPVAPAEPIAPQSTAPTSPAPVQFVAGSAPDGEPAVEAQKVIDGQFSGKVCPLVVYARRVGDGSIRASCNDGEWFTVFRLNGKPIALRCKIVEELGVSGC